jgi:predicted ATPase
VERVFALYDQFEHRSLAFLYGQDAWASAEAWLSWPLLAMGYPDQALACHRRALARATAMGHPNTLGQTLFCGCVIRQLLRDRRGVVELAEALTLLSTDQNFPYWLATATIFQGWASGEVDQAVVRIQSGLAAYRETTAQVWLPYFLSLLAEASTRAGQIVEIHGLLDEALDQADKLGERWFYAELHRLTGEVLIGLSEADRADAETRFHRAMAVAQAQRAKFWELRAATSLARLWRNQGRRAEARDLLAPVYSWFTEGFDTADLKDAKALLDELV